MLFYQYLYLLKWSSCAIVRPFACLQLKLVTVHWLTFPLNSRTWIISSFSGESPTSRWLLISQDQILSQVREFAATDPRWQMKQPESGSNRLVTLSKKVTCQGWLILRLNNTVCRKDIHVGHLKIHVIRSFLNELRAFMFCRGKDERPAYSSAQWILT